MTDAYRDDLAYIHDAGFGGFARAAGAGPRGQRYVGAGSSTDS